MNETGRGLVINGPFKKVLQNFQANMDAQCSYMDTDKTQNLGLG